MVSYHHLKKLLIPPFFAIYATRSIKRLASTDFLVRNRAWAKLYGDQFYMDLFRYFRSRTASTQTAEDLAQETYIKIHKRLEEKCFVEDTTNGFRGYVYKAARNLLNDYRRQEQRSPRIAEPARVGSDSAFHNLEVAAQGLADDPHEVLAQREELLAQHETAESAMALGMRLIDETDFMVLSLIIGAGLSSEQTAVLAGVSRRNVYRRYDRSGKQLRGMMANVDASLEREARHEKHVPLLDDPIDYGLTRFNFRLPDNLYAQEAQQELCKLFGLRRVQDIDQVCFPLLVIHRYSTLNPDPRLCLLPRSCMSWRVLDEGKEITYFDFRPFSDESPGLIGLHDMREYSAKIVNKYPGPNSLVMAKLAYDFPAGPVFVHKPIDPKVFYFAGHSDSPREVDFWFATEQVVTERRGTKEDQGY